MLSRHQTSDAGGLALTNELNRAMGWVCIVLAVVWAIGIAGDPPSSPGVAVLGVVGLVCWSSTGVALAAGSRIELHDADRAIVLRGFFRNKRLSVDQVDCCVARTDRAGGLIDARTHPTFILTDGGEVPFPLVQWSNSAADEAAAACARLTDAIRRLKA